MAKRFSAVKSIERHLEIMRTSKPLSEEWLKSEDSVVNYLLFSSCLTMEQKRKYNRIYQDLGKNLQTIR